MYSTFRITNSLTSCLHALMFFSLTESNYISYSESLVYVDPNLCSPIYVYLFTCTLHVFWIKRMRYTSCHVQNWRAGHFNDTSVKKADMFVKDVRCKHILKTCIHMHYGVQGILQSDWENSPFQAFTCLFLSYWSDYFRSTPVPPIRWKYKNYTNAELPKNLT